MLQTNATSTYRRHCPILTVLHDGAVSKLLAQAIQESRCSQQEVPMCLSELSQRLIVDGMCRSFFLILLIFSLIFFF